MITYILKGVVKNSTWTFTHQELNRLNKVRGAE